MTNLHYDIAGLNLPLFLNRKMFCLRESIPFNSKPGQLRWRFPKTSSSIKPPPSGGWSAGLNVRPAERCRGGCFACAVHLTATPTKGVLPAPAASDRIAVTLLNPRQKCLLREQPFSRAVLTHQQSCGKRSQLPVPSPWALLLLPRGDRACCGLSQFFLCKKRHKVCIMDFKVEPLLPVPAVSAHSHHVVGARLQSPGPITS